MAAPRVLEEGNVDPRREFWIVQDTQPKDEFVVLFETDPGLSPGAAWELYLDHMKRTEPYYADIVDDYADPDADYYLELSGPFGVDVR